MNRWGWIALAACVVIVAGCSSEPSSSIAVSGLIEGVTVDVGSRVGGRINTVYVDEGAEVHEGDILVRLECLEADAMVQAAQAELAQANSFLKKLEAGPREEEIKQARAAVNQADEQYQMALAGARSEEISAAEAAVQAAQVLVTDADADAKRLADLFAKNVASQRDSERAQSALEAARANLRSVQENLNLVIAGARSEEIAMAKAQLDQANAALEALNNGTREEDLEAARATVTAAEAKVQLAEANAREMTVIAPRDGVVESLDVYPGDLVKPGPLARIADPENLELVVYVSADKLGKLELGDHVQLTTDSHGEESFEGKVMQIATQGEYTPRNLQTQEERVQQMFGVKVKLDSAGGKLRAGMTATAHFDLEHINQDVSGNQRAELDAPIW